MSKKEQKLRRGQLSPGSQAIRCTLDKTQPDCWVPGSMPDSRRHRFLNALIAGEGLDAACAAAGIPVGQMIAERISNRSFRRDWHAADSERLDAVETRLIDQLIAGLERASTADKALSQIWLALRDERRRLSAGDAAKAAPPSSAPETGGDIEKSVNEMIDKVERAMAAAEAQLGLI